MVCRPQSDGAISELAYTPDHSAYGVAIDQPIVNNSVSISIDPVVAPSLVPYSVASASEQPRILGLHKGKSYQLVPTPTPPIPVSGTLPFPASFPAEQYLISSTRVGTDTLNAYSKVVQNAPSTINIPSSDYSFTSGSFQASTMSASWAHSGSASILAQVLSILFVSSSGVSSWLVFVPPSAGQVTLPPLPADLRGAVVPDGMAPASFSITAFAFSNLADYGTFLRTLLSDEPTTDPTLPDGQTSVLVQRTFKTP